MAIEPRDVLKTYFEAGDIPSADQFANLIDSFISRIDDGVYIFDVPDSSEKRFGVGVEQPLYPLGIKSAGANDGLISLHDSEDNPQWLLNMFPEGAVNSGLNIEQQTVSGGESRLFINSDSGNIGLGTLNPEQLLHLEKSSPSNITGTRFLNVATLHQGWKMGHLQDALPERDGAFVFIDSDSDGERLTLRSNGNFGINEMIPDTILHVSRPASDPEAVISLVEGTGIAVIGPITDNLVFDFEGIQARHGEYIGPVLDLQTSPLNLQPLGGDLLIHGGDTTTEEQKIIFTNDGFAGLGIITPTEKLDVNGAVKIGNTSTENTGTIRWTGADFEGRTEFDWVSLTAGNGPWTIGDGDIIYYNQGTAPRIGIGTNAVKSTLTLESHESVIQGSTAAIIRNNSTTVGTGSDDNRVALMVLCNGSWGGDPLSKDIGLYVPEVVGQIANEVNLAAVLNGNVVIGDLPSVAGVIGTNGSRVLAIQTGTAPDTAPEANSVQLYSADNSDAVPILHVMSGNGDIIKIYKETALTPAVGEAFDPDYNASVIDILNNMRTRINELELKLQSLGVIA